MENNLSEKLPVKVRIKKRILAPLFLFLLALPIVLITVYLGQQKTIIQQNAQSGPTTPNVLASYCSGGYYRIPGEKTKCSRAPWCGGFDYDTLDTASYQISTSCIDSGPIVGGSSNGQSAFNGYVPLCCYVMADVGNYQMCMGYFERKYCSVNQCNQARSHGAVGTQCGQASSTNCGCSSGLDQWAVTHSGQPGFGVYSTPVSEIPLSQRLSGVTIIPSSSLTPTTPVNTPVPNTPVPSATPVPGTPTPTVPLPTLTLAATAIPSPYIDAINVPSKDFYSYNDFFLLALLMGLIFLAVYL
jgi:hypothetical protein